MHHGLFFDPLNDSATKAARLRDAQGLGLALKITGADLDNAPDLCVGDHYPFRISVTRIRLMGLHFLTGPLLIAGREKSPHDVMLRRFELNIPLSPQPLETFGSYASGQRIAAPKPATDLSC